MRSSNTTEDRKLAVVVVAAGESRRFGSDKLAATIGDRTVLERSVEAMRNALADAPLVVAVASARVEFWRHVLEPKVDGLEVIVGGERRQDSVRIGVERAAADGAEIVVIHDGARPLVHPDDVRRVVAGLGDGSAAILCAEVVDTVKRIDDEGIVVDTIDRSMLRTAQTPQICRVAALESAWAVQNPSVEFSDEAALLESAGVGVRCVVGEHPNPKLTTVDDMLVVRSLGGDDA